MSELYIIVVWVGCNRHFPFIYDIVNEETVPKILDKFQAKLVERENDEYTATYTFPILVYRKNFDHDECHHENPFLYIIEKGKYTIKYLMDELEETLD